MAKMADDAATAELDRIAADLEIVVDPETTEIVLRALKSGRLEWDAEEQQFAVELKNPIELDNGKTINMLMVTEPTAAQIKKAQSISDQFEQSLKLVASCTDQPIGYIERLKVRDLNLLGALVGFFR